MKLDGQALRKARTDAGLSRATLHERSGVSTATIQRAEDESHVPSATNLAAIAAVLGVSMESLFQTEIPA